MGEVRYGEWEGEKIEELAKLPEWHVVQHVPSRHQFPSGESLREVQFRVINALEKLAASHADDMIAVCSHADLIKLILAHYLGTHIDLFQRIVISPASASVLMLGKKGEIRVLRTNDTGPIPAPPPPKKQEEEEKKDSAEVKMSEHIELNPASHITVGTIGEPGNRTFYLQGSQGRNSISLIIEKQQASMLAEGLESLFRDLAKERPELITPMEPGSYAVDLRLRQPLEALYRVGRLGLGYSEGIAQGHYRRL